MNDSIDITEIPIQIRISEDRKTVWINNQDRCPLRATRIPELDIDDMSKR